MFPLQCCGWDVDSIHTTDYLNHPGHGTFQGTRNNGEFIVTILDGLRRIFTLKSHYNAILVGYCPSADVMSAIHNELRPIYADGSKETRPFLVMDPVLGDNGRLYVPEDVVQVHRDFLTLGYVDLTTPNQFEMELLTGVKIDSWETIRKACDIFERSFKVHDFVILSVLIVDGMYSVGYSGDTKQTFCVPIEEIQCRFSGCGDIFTALLTDEYYSNGQTLSPEVLGLVVRKLHKILKTTYDQQKKKSGIAPEVVNDVNLILLRHFFELKLGHGIPVKYL